MDTSPVITTGTASADPTVALGLATKQYVDNLGTVSIVSNETPGGSINGSNTAYTTASTYATGTLQVYLNGQRLVAGSGNDYVEVTQGFTMQYAPATGDVLLVGYLVSNATRFITGSNSIIVQETPTGTVNGSTTLFTTLQGKYVANSLEVFVNGLQQTKTTDYAETSPGSGTFTFTTAPATGDIVRVSYQFSTGASGNADTVDGFHGNDLTPLGVLQPYVGRTAPAYWLLCDGSAISRTTYAGLFNIIAPVVGTFTITIATPAVVTLNGHGFQTADALYLTTTGALPTGLSANTIYYAVRIDANTFNLATSAANAIAGTKITTTGSQSGTHTLNACPYGLGDGSTTFNIPDMRGRVAAGNDAMNGTAASRLTNPSTTLNGTYGNLGASGGEQAHVQTLTELAAHTHTITAPANSTVGGNPNFFAGNNGGSFSPTSSSAGSSVAANVVQPTLITNYIIKAL
jgi:microcystin-dependent protein